MTMTTSVVTEWRGKSAWAVTSAASTLRIVVSSMGGHLVSITSNINASTINPLWQPKWPSGAPSDAATSGTWGFGPEAALLTSICGSNLCCDRFGGDGSEGRPLHGEVGVTVFSPVSDDSGAFSVAAVLPIARLHVTRSFQLQGTSTLLLTTRIRCASGDAKDTSEPRYCEWAEHTTLGDPFLDGVTITAGADVAVGMPAEGTPDGAPLQHVDVAAALAFPRRSDAPEGHVRTTRIIDGVWTAENAALGWRLKALFDPRDFPFLCIWSVCCWCRRLKLTCINHPTFPSRYPIGIAGQSMLSGRIRRGAACSAQEEWS